jgi:hypothetical protein
MLVSASLISGCTTNHEEDGIDIDFTRLSNTLMQAEYHRIGMDIESYLGKTMRVSGRYEILTLSEDEVSHIIMLMDGDECCQMGIEFKLEEENGYPAIGTMIEINGVLALYESREHRYVYLRADKLEVVREH